MENFDWSKFSVRINVNATIDELYKAWATKRGIERWFLKQSDFENEAGQLLKHDDFVKTNDKYTWRWFGYPDSVTEQGEILDANGSNTFKFRFGKAGVCTVNIRTEHGETLVELIQDEIPTDEKGKQNFHIGCKGGWTFYLANLKSIYEGGVDLRNKNEKLQEVINS
jgi:uncharacterized protein YndB with AHSA1/START domain